MRSLAVIILAIVITFKMWILIDDNKDKNTLNSHVIINSKAISGSNVIPIRIDHSGYENELVISVTICSPGTDLCKTIDRILLDTGSSGLRIFNSLVSDVSLINVESFDGSSVARCMRYMDGTSQWGPIKKADIKLGGEIARNINIQIIDADYANGHEKCDNPERDPSKSQYNGILGIGVHKYDCSECAVNSSIDDEYFKCINSNTCSPSLMSLEYQVVNPISVLDSSSNEEGINDGNGSAIVLPQIPAIGANYVSGYLIIGIGTRSNNTPSKNSVIIESDRNGYFDTFYDGGMYRSHIDTGSNKTMLPTPSRDLDCSEFKCFFSIFSLLAAQKVNNGESFKIVSLDHPEFQKGSVGNGDDDDDFPADNDRTFVWGLPFFYGKTVYTSINGKMATFNGVTYLSPFYAIEY